RLVSDWSSDVCSSDLHAPAEQHADAGEPEAGPPADRDAKSGAQHRSPERAEVDAEIVERESRVATRVALRVKLADDCRDVRLEEIGRASCRERVDRAV